MYQYLFSVANFGKFDECRPPPTPLHPPNQRAENLVPRRRCCVKCNQLHRQGQQCSPGVSEVRSILSTETPATRALSRPVLIARISLGGDGGGCAVRQVRADPRAKSGDAGVRLGQRPLLVLRRSHLRQGGHTSMHIVHIHRTYT